MVRSLKTENLKTNGWEIPLKNRLDFLKASCTRPRLDCRPSPGSLPRPGPREELQVRDILPTVPSLLLPAAWPFLATPPAGASSPPPSPGPFLGTSPQLRPFLGPPPPTLWGNLREYDGGGRRCPLLFTRQLPQDCTMSSISGAVGPRANESNKRGGVGNGEAGLGWRKADGVAPGRNGGREGHEFRWPGGTGTGRHVLKQKSRLDTGIGRSRMAKRERQETTRGHMTSGY